MKSDLCDRVREATRDLMAGLSLELVDVEITQDRGRSSLSLSIDRPGGVTVDDCARASDLVGQVLEREQVVRGPFVLEVMSPGLDRPLKRPADYAGSIGKKVKVRLLEPVGGRRRYNGSITAAGGEQFELATADGEVVLRYENVSKARLDPELPW